MRFIKEVYPEARITHKKMTSGPLVTTVIGPDAEEVITVDQRQLYRKYGWPAGDEIKEAVAALKLDD
eukprot:COSAG04_NODE_474_length_13783_cov_18.185691_10_plen_67_part_00